MLYILSLITAVLVILSGVFVLAKGSWQKMGLKFAGVALSTMAALWLFAANFVYGVGIFHGPNNVAPAASFSIQLYFVLRNVAFIIFNIAVGRDAIFVKKLERRGSARCQTNSLKPLPH